MLPSQATISQVGEILDLQEAFAKNNCFHINLKLISLRRKSHTECCLRIAIGVE